MRHRAILFAALFVTVAGCANLAPAQAESGQACKAYQLIDDVTGEIIIGPEDLAIDRTEGAVLVSAYDRRAVKREDKAGGPITTEGGIYRFRISDGLPEGDKILVTDLTREFKKTHDFRPHGIDLDRGKDNRRALYVVNHLLRLEESDDPGTLAPHVIDRFILDPSGALMHDKRIRASVYEDKGRMCSPNDVVGVGGGRFFVSNDHGSCGGFGAAWEETFALKGSYLLYYDGEQFRRVAEKLKFANGVAMREDPATGARLIFVSETRGKRIRVFDEAELLSPGEAIPRYTIKIKGSPDNMDWSEDGDLLVATIPNIIGMGAYMRGWFGKKKTSSRTQKIAWNEDGPDKPEIVFEDDGSMISGATAMAGAGGLYFIGAAFDDNIAICTARSAG